MLLNKRIQNPRLYDRLSYFTTFYIASCLYGTNDHVTAIGHNEILLQEENMKTKISAD
jgi:hypothetical protein